MKKFRKMFLKGASIFFLLVLSGCTTAIPSVTKFPIFFADKSACKNSDTLEVTISLDGIVLDIQGGSGSWKYYHNNELFLSVIDCGDGNLVTIAP